MKEKVMSTMQAFSKSYLRCRADPSALPAVGKCITNARLIEILPFLDNPVTKGFESLFRRSAVAILNNLD